MRKVGNTNFDAVMNELQKVIKDWFDTNMIAYDATDYSDSVSWLVAFIELQRRLITPVKRKIKISNGLQLKILNGTFDSFIINGLSHIVLVNKSRQKKYLFSSCIFRSLHKQCFSLSSFFKSRQRLFH